jgi:ligand-binding sensor domain-containing protein
VRRPWAALPSSQVTDIASGPNGEVWIATNGGLWRRTVDGETLTAVVENAPLPYPTVLGVAVDRRGVAWAATVAGAAAVDAERNGRAFNGRTAPLMHQLLDAAYVDRAGRVWFGGAGGVNVYEPPTTWSEPGRWPSGFNRWLTDGALPDSLVFTIFEDSRGRMWFGTDGGAAALSPDPGAYSLGSDQRARWLTFTTATSPLLHDKTHAIAEDRQGRIYLGTESGVSIYDESVPAERRWSAIQGSRLPHPYVDTLLAAPDGRMWIGTKNGLTVYDPRQPAAELPVYRAHPLRYWTGLFWAPHASMDVPANEITALAWSP